MKRIADIVNMESRTIEPKCKANRSSCRCRQEAYDASDNHRAHHANTGFLSVVHACLPMFIPFLLLKNANRVQTSVSPLTPRETCIDEWTVDELALL
jgi:hypothetical protein